VTANGRALCAWALAGVILAVEPRVARAEPSSSTSAPEPVPQKLTVTVVASESMVSTLRERVASWFTDGTTVDVVVTSELDQSLVLSARAGEVNAWVIPVSPERALVTFSTLAGEHERHLIRELRLLHGLDDLGLERLASVIHSAFIALEEGSENMARADAERALGEAGLSAATSAPAVDFEKPRPAPETPPRPVAPAPVRPSNPPRTAHNAQREWMLAAGYGIRARGAEGLAHGPEARFGARARGERIAFDLAASGQWLWRSHFAAAPFTASVQTTAVRVQAGVEPSLGGAWHGRAELGGGLDLANIHASANAHADNVGVRSTGTQVRPTGSAAVGVVYAAAMIDLGVSAELAFLLDDVRYSVGTAQGEQRLLAPARVEPGLSLWCRFRGPW